MSRKGMRHGIGIASVFLIVLIIGGYFGYQFYAEHRSRSERISSLMKYANTTDYDKASLFDEKYSYLASDGKYNQSVLDFFLRWLSNNSLDYTQYLYERQRSERISSLMKYVDTSDYNKAFLFDEKYSHMANDNAYNQSVLEFFSYWLLNQSLAETCLEILGTVGEANNYLSKLDSYATSYCSKDNFTLVLSVSTDRDEYPLSIGEVNFTVIILSNKDLGYVKIDIFGFKSRYGGYVVNNKWINNTSVLKIPVGKGFNSKSFSIDVPCSPCYGVASGLNSLTCVIKYNSLNLNVTKTFLLK